MCWLSSVSVLVCDTGVDCPLVHSCHCLRSSHLEQLELPVLVTIIGHCYSVNSITSIGSSATTSAASEVVSGSSSPRPVNLPTTVVVFHPA